MVHPFCARTRSRRDIQVAMGKFLGGFRKPAINNLIALATKGRQGPRGPLHSREYVNKPRHRPLIIYTNYCVALAKSAERPARWRHELETQTQLESGRPKAESRNRKARPNQGQVNPPSPNQKVNFHPALLEC